MDMLLENIVWG